MAAVAAGDEAAPAPKTTFGFLNLPPETQLEILSHCSQSELICVALVSKHFHELASTHLYRSFNILFPDEDDLRFDCPIDGLAGGLDSFTTSDYNYAKHLKELSMDTVSTGSKAEQAYKPYIYAASCGKFMNTLLYITLKKAKSLETFRWNIRVELSRPVYQELHKIQTLTALHIRMQAGESYYTTPPPLPLMLDDAPASVQSPDLPSPPNFPIPLAGNATTIPGSNGSSHGSFPMSKSRSKPGKRSPPLREPPTLSGFKLLKTLSVLDIDSLDVVTELKTCVRNSSATLKELQLSFSDFLALQARRPRPDSDPDDSDVEDEFQVVPASQGSTFESSGPSKAFRSQEERKLQESVLGRIFDVEPFIVKKSQFPPSPRDSAGGNDQKEDSEHDEAADPGKEFISSMRGVSSRLMSQINGSRDFSSEQQDILDTIEKAARKYIESGGLSTKTPDDSSPSGSKDDEDSKQNEGSQEHQSENKDTSGSVASGSRSKGKNTEGEVSPEDIEIEHLDVDDVDDDSDDQGAKDIDEKLPVLDPTANGAITIAPTPPLEVTRAIINLAAQLTNTETLSGKLSHFRNQADLLGQKLKNMSAGGANTNIDQVNEAESQLRELLLSIIDIQHQIKTAEAEIIDATRQLPTHPKEANDEQTRRSMEEYIRDTRGVSLETLSIHLIPVKASVLSRAMDLRCIRNLTLLNVGNQAPIWTLLAKENKVHPLALRSVFTDNVSTAFLTCMSQLDELHELFMLERSAKYKPESFAPKTTITIDQIRRLVLKKHMLTLKRLMIKDESNGSNWDVNQKAMILICNRGIQLEELAISMNIHAVHAFMQYFSGLVNLRAIHILHFRNNDTCIWVMREILNFIVDNLSHHPELKLEWIAMEDDRLDHVIRPSESAKKGEEGSKRRDKGKGKAVTGPNHDDNTLPVLPMSDWGSDTDSDEDDDDAFHCGKRLRLKTVGVLQFYDVWGIKIFDKEIRSGRL
ncbi:hypothetical protein EDB81DRAFT_79565 [Dactylonectria macrodidyma]|uniref:F-box domain-containing protein n=1 Tax=Dactylonectria macrodidyma TaxID=307937 RepID=A0A9P9IZW7_9HYPO|nr:hypothetical protein EDB81DRAFT_79565 [Dactylonectria macrodidyma]